MNGSPLTLSAQLELAMQKLVSETRHCEVQHWGKIEGTVKDYYIALGINYNGEAEFPSKTFYWCSSRNFNFAELPKPKDEIRNKVDKINSLFSGEYDQILAKQDGEERKIVLDDDDAMPLIIKPKNITELDRLGHVV